MPKPPAAFSPLMATKSSFQSRTSPGRRSTTMARPLRPTMSPMNRIRTRSRPHVDDLALGEHEIEGRVARGGWNRVDLLGSECDADRGHLLHGAEPGEGHIVV